MQVKMSWVVAVSSMAFLAACTQGPSLNGAAPGSSTSAATANVPAGAPVTIHCGDGKQALVKQVMLGGQTVSQVECIDATQTLASRDTVLLDDRIQVEPPPPPVRRVVQTLPPVRERVIVREVPQRVETEEDVYVEEEPRVIRTSTTTREESPAPAPAPVRKKRSGKDSALIIGGTTAAGAGVGAVIGGKKGAIIGGIIGAAGGTVFDRTTRNKK